MFDIHRFQLQSSEQLSTFIREQISLKRRVICTRSRMQNRRRSCYSGTVEWACGDVHKRLWSTTLRFKMYFVRYEKGDISNRYTFTWKIGSKDMNPRKLLSLTNSRSLPFHGRHKSRTGVHRSISRWSVTSAEEAVGDHEISISTVRCVSKHWR
jgi:hypothetical protein